MLVCHCKAVSESQVRHAVLGGARTRSQVARACGAGAVCGGCRPVVDDILSERCQAPSAPTASAGLALAPSK